MKAKIPIVCAAVLLLGAATSQAVLTLDVYEDTVIQPGEEFNIVRVYEDATVGMTGGRIYSLFAEDSSKFSLFDGQIDVVYLQDDSRLYMYGGQHGVGLMVQDFGIVSVFGGNFFADINIWNQSSGKVIFYGHDFQLEYDSAKQGQILTGYLLDGSPLRTFLRSTPEPYIGPNYAIVPEPSTLLILTIGALMIARQRMNRENYDFTFSHPIHYSI